MKIAMTIWERRLKLERQERAERDLALEPVRQKYAPLYEALKQECEATGHEWTFTTLTVGGDALFQCNYCRKSRREER